MFADLLDADPLFISTVSYCKLNLPEENMSCLFFSELYFHDVIPVVQEVTKSVFWAKPHDVGSYNIEIPMNFDVDGLFHLTDLESVT